MARKNYDWFPDENDFMHPSQRGYRVAKGGRTPVLAGRTPLANAESLSLVGLSGAVSPEQADSSNEFYERVLDELRAYQAKNNIPPYPKK